MALSYDYYCAANGKTLSVRHGMNDTISTWGELCALNGQSDTSAEDSAPIEKVISGGQLALKRRVSKEAPRRDLDAILTGPGDQCLPCCGSSAVSEQSGTKE